MIERQRIRGKIRALRDAPAAKRGRGRATVNDRVERPVPCKFSAVGTVNRRGTWDNRGSERASRSEAGCSGAEGAWKCNALSLKRKPSHGPSGAAKTWTENRRGHHQAEALIQKNMGLRGSWFTPRCLAAQCTGRAVLLDPTRR